MQINNKLRAALASILGIADHLQMRFEIPKLANQGISELKQIAESALAEPVKNCEIGTAEEQFKRFMHFCDSRVCNRRYCACGYEELFRHKCAIRWAQMPYAEQEGGAK